MGVRRNAGRIDFEAISAVLAPVNESWFNAHIQIINPDISGGAYNRVANTKQRTPEVLWDGPARIQAQRWPNVATARQEAVSERTVVFHLPLDSDPTPELILEGWRIKVLDGGLSPQFTHGLFVITTSVNSSYDWDRRIETVFDNGAPI